MGNNVLTRVDKVSAYYVRFRWGSTGKLLLTDVGEDDRTALDSDPFLADPALEITLGARTGLLNESVTTIRFDLETSELGRSVSSGRAFPKVRVEIWEKVDGYDPQRFQQKFNRVFKGTAVKSRRNPEGYPGTVELDCHFSKNRLDFAAGMQCNAECANTFGKGGCSVNVASLADACTITSISRNIITVTGLTAQPDSRYWRRGYIERNGLEIQILEWDGSQTFDLAKVPPAEWFDAVLLGDAQATMYPGCDLLRSTCDDVWGNVQDFNGLGLTTPPYHPVIENPER